MKQVKICYLLLLAAVFFGIIQGGGCMLETSANETEYDMFKDALRFYKLEDWKNAHDVLTEVWKIYNLTEACRYSHGIDLTDVIYYLQQVAGNLEEYSQAKFLCEWALANLGMTESKKDGMLHWKAVHEKNILEEDEIQTNGLQKSWIFFYESKRSRADRENEKTEELSSNGFCALAINETERSMFDEALEFHKEENWEFSYKAFIELWAVYNISERCSYYPHGIDLPSVIYYIQRGAGGLGNYSEARYLCKWAMSNLELSTIQEQDLQRWIDYYNKQLGIVEEEPIEEKKSLEDEWASFYERKRSGSRDSCLGSNTTERALFDAALKLHKQNSWTSSYAAFMELWQVYNTTEKQCISDNAQAHGIDLPSVIYYIQMAAAGLGDYIQAIFLCQWARTQLQLTEFQENDLKRLVSNYEKAIAEIEELSRKAVDWHCQLPINETERTLFNIALRLNKQHKWNDSYKLFMELWEIYNFTEHHSYYPNHGIDLASVIYYLQFAAGNLKKYQEATFLCNWALEELSLTDSQAIDLTNQVSVYNGRQLEQIEALPEVDQQRITEWLVSREGYEYCKKEIALQKLEQLSKDSRLFCRLSNRQRHPLLILSPVKEEFFSIDPLVILMHDLVRPSEIDKFKKQAEPSMKLAEILANGDVYNADNRFAETAWIDTDVMAELTMRIEAYTGLSADENSSEHYQVCRYGRGGHFVPHFDSGVANEEQVLAAGDRVATMMLYLSEVPKGGATEFTRLEMAIFPVKGAGLFWYNLHRNESIDERSLHGGCPVEAGRKWIVNKWFRSRGQLHSRPCKLSQEVDFSIQDFDGFDNSIN